MLKLVTKPALASRGNCHVLLRTVTSTAQRNHRASGLARNAMMSALSCASGTE
jgi:hypothetical protein